MKEYGIFTRQWYATMMNKSFDKFEHLTNAFYQHPFIIHLFCSQPNPLPPFNAEICSEDTVTWLQH